MLSCGRVAGSQLCRITRNVYSAKIPYPVRVGFISTSCVKYNTKGKKNKSGTAKVEECLPKKKSYERVPPLPPPPPPPAPLSSAPPLTPQDLKLQMSGAAPCDVANYSCPADCPIAEDCHKPGGAGTNEEGFKYWKHVIAALVVAGVSAYAYLEWFTETDEEKTVKVGKYKRRPVEPIPQNSNSIPAEVPYVLIGSGTAAFSAFRSIKSRDPKAKVLMITNEGDFPYMRPPLSKELWYNREETVSPKLTFRQWNGVKRSLFHEPPEFYLGTEELQGSENGGIAVARGWQVKKIDVPSKTIYLSDNYGIKYDKCLIATGASPKNLPIFESANKKIKEKIVLFRTKDDFLELVHNLKNADIKDIVIIGGGFLGSELSTSIARNFRDTDKNVHQIYKEKYVLSQVLPEYLCKWAVNRLESEGVQCKSNVEVHDVVLQNGRLHLTLTDGSTMDADQVVVAIGVEANTGLAQTSNLEIHPEHGGFLVNAELEARNDVWVAGDAACFYDVKLGRRRVEHHDHAVVSGKLAGENMTGARKPYLHQSMFWSDLGPEAGFEAIGIIDSTLQTVGVFAKGESDRALAAVSNQISSGDEKSNDKSKSDNQEVKPVAVSSKSDKSGKTSKEEDDFSKGVIFYVRDDTVVGILLWNVYNRMAIARQLLARGTTYEEINEAAKLFTIHED
ncbi:hypothetical protein QAD02_011479 [Eretmocerus hayati]|uniref:Uncharacterized protein n=1 Tax=Eretmocerus hayati TaxID=131215 RepID=A0ACC2NXW0_9HYME|nr:hypothetical protein QAD02_011479 [Eretmocerus hayati]